MRVMRSWSRFVGVTSLPLCKGWQCLLCEGCKCALCALHCCGGQQQCGAAACHSASCGHQVLYGGPEEGVQPREHRRASLSFLLCTVASKATTAATLVHSRTPHASCDGFYANMGGVCSLSVLCTVQFWDRANTFRQKYQHTDGKPFSPSMEMLKVWRLLTPPPPRPLPSGVCCTAGVVCIIVL